ncbi:PEP-CTERM sorting domain-containing protein [Geitlerinema sp. PCC 9228]|jgi:hypothetical protein|uniref:PEP-CTERM sorting domain-containing protein n=1 Tax=Geitlerinema sp. PCC 9228 TaxID=111611 RepID=UPI0008F98A91|nr:PEP-CTERM sorting domain-containing protein [Geitlerinema sp. PCC 9228]
MKPIISTLLAASTAAAGLAIAEPATAFTIRSASEADEQTQSLMQNDFQKYFNEDANNIADEVKDNILQPNELVLNFPHQVKTYFINENAKYRNQLGFTATDSQGNVIAEDLIFEDVSRKNGPGRWQSGGDLEVGDFVDLGMFDADTKFDFWLVANGDEDRIFGANPEENPDGRQHLAAYRDSGHVILGFEDQMASKSDWDYNDGVFAVDFGEGNAASMPTAVPEPSSTLAFLGVAAVGLAAYQKRRR